MGISSFIAARGGRTLAAGVCFSRDDPLFKANEPFNSAEPESKDASEPDPELARARGLRRGGGGGGEGGGGAPGGGGVGGGVAEEEAAACLSGGVS